MNIETFKLFKKLSAGYLDYYFSDVKVEIEETPNQLNAIGRISDSRKEIIIQVPTKLIADFDDKLKGKMDMVNKKPMKALENILAFASLLSGKAYYNWLEDKHPRVTLISTTIQQLLGYKYRRVVELLEKEKIIIVNPAYHAGQYCKHYWLDERYLKEGMEDYEIKDQFVRNRYLKMLENRVINGTED